MQGKDCHGFGNTLDGDRLECFGLDSTGRKHLGGGRNKDLAWLRRLLHSRRNRHCWTRGVVLDFLPFTNCQDDDFTGMKPHTYLQATAVTRLHTRGIIPHALLHPERRATGIHGMMLARNRGPEHRHDPIPHEGQASDRCSDRAATAFKMVNRWPTAVTPTA